jgi:hypothetical protein
MGRISLTEHNQRVLTIYGIVKLHQKVHTNYVSHADCTDKLIKKYILKTKLESNTY